MNDKRMYILLCFLICTVFMLLSGCGREAQKNIEGDGYKVIDDLGAEVDFTHAPKRILSLSMGLDSIILGLNPQNNLVAISRLADDPTSSNIVEQAKKIPVKIKNPSAEEVLSLKPDVVFINDWGNPEIINNLRDLGFKVIVVKGPDSIEAVRNNIKLVAKVLQQDERGASLIAAMDARLKQIKDKVATIPVNERKRVVLVSLMTAYGGIGSSFDDMCKHAGVENGLAAIGLLHGQQLTKELLVKIDPDVLIMPVYNDHGKFDINKYNNEFLNDPSLQTMKAIKNKRLFYPHEGYIYNSSQDIVLGVQEIARAAYGDELFAMQEQEHLEVK